MEGVAELRGMWELPATWKLVRLLSRPLSFSAPSPSQLEDALLNPNENLTMIANIHGRLLGLSTGASSAKKWMQSTSRFIRNRPDDFSFMETEERNSAMVESEPLRAEVKEEPVEEEGDRNAEADNLKSAGRPETRQPFPTEEERYFRLRASTRLLVLYTISEIILSEHDSLLYTGSITDLELVELRQDPVGSDAVGNKYWYFGDCERIYREPGKKNYKTRRQQADDDAKAAKEAEKAAAAKAARIAKEEKRKEAERKREEIRRRREERKRKSMEKWGPRVAASRTTRASSRAERHLFKVDEVDASRVSAVPSGKKEVMDTSLDPASHDGGEPWEQANAKPSARKRSSSAMSIERRSSTRRRKPPSNEAESIPVRTPKKRRRNERFTDPELRLCENWELISIGSEGLKELIDRFRTQKGGVLSSEKGLVRVLEEEILPEIVESEAKARKEQEREERKLRTELLYSVQKRSSRVQALEQKREEEARRAAEEEERERLRLEGIAERAEIVKAQVAALRKEQSRGIRVARRAHGRTEAIERDDELHSMMDRKVARHEAHIEQSKVRRSTRSLRASRRISETQGFPSSGLADASGEQSTSKIPLSEYETHGEREEKLLAFKDQPQMIDGTIAGNREGLVTEDASNAVEADRGEHDAERDSTNKNDLREAITDQMEGAGSGKDLGHSCAGIDTYTSFGRSEVGVGDAYTWSINPDDKEPIRVLDEFFFASKTDFADAPLETCDSDQSHVIGFGVLLPPPNSTTDARLVEIEKVEDWSIEYGADHKLWVKSKHAWYELRNPSVEYREAYVSTRRKYELCIRIAIIGTTFKPAELTYGSIVDLLSYRYEDMLSYTTPEILQEKRFIVAQMESLGKRPILQSGFIRELKKKIKAEDMKVAAENRRTNAAPEQKDWEQSKEQKMVGPVEGNKKASPQTVDGRSKPAKVRTKRRSSSTGRPVPRAVSSIISGLLRAATKSRAPVRKRKRKQDGVGDKVVHAATTTRPGKVNGMHDYGVVGAHETPLDSMQAANGSVPGIRKQLNVPEGNGRLPRAILPRPADAQLVNGTGLASLEAERLLTKQRINNHNNLGLPGRTDPTIAQPISTPERLHGNSAPSCASRDSKILYTAPTVKSHHGSLDLPRIRDPVNTQPGSTVWKSHGHSMPSPVPGHPKMLYATPSGKPQLPTRDVSGAERANLTNSMNRTVRIAPRPTDEAQGHTEGNGLSNGLLNGITEHADKVAK